jgi:competence protein ComEA
MSRKPFSLLCLALVLGLAAAGADAATPVNVNKADAATIANSLDGIGPAKAAAIVAWREEHGPFKSVDEVGQVKGVSAATLDRNRQAILLTGDGGGAADTAKAAAPSKGRKKAARTRSES